MDKSLPALRGRVQMAEAGLENLFAMAQSVSELASDLTFLRKVRLARGEAHSARQALKLALNRAAPDRTISPQKIEMVSARMIERIKGAVTPPLKTYLRAIVSGVVVSKDAVTISGANQRLEEAVSSQSEEEDPGPFRTFRAS